MNSNPEISLSSIVEKFHVPSPMRDADSKNVALQKRQNVSRQKVSKENLIIEIQSTIITNNDQHIEASDPSLEERSTLDDTL